MAATASSRVNRSLRTTEPSSDFNAAVVLSRLIAATERLAVFPESGRSVPEFQSRVVGEVIVRPYRRRFSIGPPRPMVSP